MVQILIASATVMRWLGAHVVQERPVREHPLHLLGAVLDPLRLGRPTYGVLMRMVRSEAEPSAPYFTPADAQPFVAETGGHAGVPQAVVRST